MSKLSPAARCVATLAVVALTVDEQGKVPRGVYRILSNLACNWDSKAIHIKWEAYGASQGAIDILSEQCEWGDGSPEAHGWALCDFAQAILRADDAQDRQVQIDKAEDYVLEHLDVVVDLQAGANSVQAVTA